VPVLADGTGAMTKPLRRAMDLSTFFAAVALVAVLGWHFSGQVNRERDVDTVRDGLRRFEQALSVRAATKESASTARGWPMTIDPTWFGGDPPRNTLVTPERPWVEIAPPTEAKLKNPNIRIAVDWSTAAFWYNPYLGILRARVPYDISDERARDLYNLVNGTNVDSIYGVEAVLPEDLFIGPPAELASPFPLPPSEDQHSE
jgi:hypothetical protein